MKSIIAALFFGAIAIVATPTTASAKVKPGKTYNWVYQLVEVTTNGKIVKRIGTYIFKSACEADAKTWSYTDAHVCIRKQP